jgi:MoaA/NifB/PqqE/SkfB family radical SAM enzyme
MPVLDIMNKKVARLDLKTGYSCNNDCLFCVAADKRKFKDKDTCQLKEDLLNSYREGKREVVFTGGECTLRKDIIDLVKYARFLGYSLVQIQTNARRLADLSFAKEIVKAGANQFAPALHSHKQDIHDYLTQRKGSWRQTVLGISNLRKLKVVISSNTVITKQNYRYLPQIAGFLAKLGVFQFQFAFPHIMGNTYRNYKEVVPRISETAGYIKKGIDEGMKYNVRPKVEAVTPCFLQGYEKFISELRMPPVQVKEVAWQVDDFESLRKNKAKVKFSQCVHCKWYAECEGPWKEYPEIFGNKEFKPA